jgi:hypothetical protein
MLHLAHKISGAAVRGTDVDIGTLEDFYFEENRWTVRYLLVDTGKWFSGKRVLISPMSVDGEWGRTGVPLRLTKEQVWNSPEIKEGEELVKREMLPGDAVHVTPPTVHRMTAIEDCDVFEVSTPELDDVVRLEDRYGRRT